MTMNEIDAYLQCIRVCCHGTKCIVGRLSLARKFGVIPVDSIRARVETVREEAVGGSIHKSDARCSIHFKVCAEDPD